MGYSARLDGLAAKIEATYGTDSTPGPTTDAVRVSERVWSSINISHAFENLRPDAASGSLFELFPAEPGGRVVELEIAWDARGAGAAYASGTTYPEASPLFRSCGLDEAFDATPGDETVTYTPLDTGHESCTIYAYAGSMLFKIVGCRGNLVWPVTAGQLGVMRFRMRGIMESAPSNLALPAFTYQAVVPEPAAGLGMSVDGTWSPDLISAELDLGANVQQLDSGNAAEGVGEFAISGFAPRYRLQARTPSGATPLTTYDPYDDVRTREPRTLVQALGTGGDSTTYNRINLDVTDAYVRDPQHVDNNGFVAWDLEYILQDLAIVFD